MGFDLAGDEVDVYVLDWRKGTVRIGDDGPAGSLVIDEVNLFDDPSWSPLNTDPRDRIAARNINGTTSISEITTWHHEVEPGVFLLLDYDAHELLAHGGGRQLWGDGDLTASGLALFDGVEATVDL